MQQFDEASIEVLVDQGLSGRSIKFPVAESGENDLSPEIFRDDFVNKETPLVVRGMVNHFPAVSKWRDLSYFIREHGYRLVPVELGSMLSKSSGGMKERTLTLGEFVSRYLLSNDTSNSVTSLAQALNETNRVAYMAQHPLLNQIPTLQDDLDMKVEVCGPNHPTQINVWMGTGGTRTPLHYDSYDNWLVQIVGAKYVRLYDRSQTEKLYVNDNPHLSYGKQGNMSELNCEAEDFDKHSLAREAQFSEVLLLPGDALFIPCGCWHYVRSLTTSISVNYWF